ncbi:hypothetical protein GCM10010330_35220 [Streptomyces tendae]|nr:hypothetical protein GCM10010330_35220 [Streptomyces tendae]
MPGRYGALPGVPRPDNPGRVRHGRDRTRAPAGGCRGLTTDQAPFRPVSAAIDPTGIGRNPRTDGNRATE